MQVRGGLCYQSTRAARAEIFNPTVARGEVVSMYAWGVQNWPGSHVIGLFNNAWATEMCSMG